MEEMTTLKWENALDERAPDACGVERRGLARDSGVVMLELRSWSPTIQPKIPTKEGPIP
jgi:hypothetical protein